MTTQSRLDEAPRPAAAAAPELICYPLVPDPPEIRPALAQRDWMDQSNQRYAYRCLPLSIANASGWELLSPVSFEASWNGSSALSAITVRSREDEARARRFVQSHFGEGILTIITGYLFRTSPGWALWVRGSPNQAKRNLAPLDGLVETDWLDFPFTMNWRFTRSGTIEFRKGEPFCFITPVAHRALDAIEPQIRALEDDSELEASYRAWSRSRTDFNASLAARDPDTVAQGWQRHYMRGEDGAGRQAGFHVTKRRLKPAVRTGKVPPAAR